jgi:hypothetical protein
MQGIKHDIECIIQATKIEDGGLFSFSTKLVSREEALKELGFSDPANNGLAYRLKLPGKLIEICYYFDEGFFRLQSCGSGFTIPLRGITSVNQLKLFISFISDEK